MTTSQPTYSAVALGFLWFGAAVSIAEIYTGASLAQAPFNSALLALLSGHLVGALILALIAYIGFRERQPSLICSRLSFGLKGSWVLSILNILQLIGWTTVMIQQSGQALGVLGVHFFEQDYTQAGILIMGVFVAIWTLWQIKGRYHWNSISVALMFVLCVVMTLSLFHQLPTIDWRSEPLPSDHEMSFQMAFTLSLVMPLSWAPLMADYTCRARTAIAAVVAPALGYTVGSLWMYSLGWLGTLATGIFNPSEILIALGLGAVALGVVMLSTVTTAFLDVYSTITSTHNIVPQWSATLIALGVVVLGTLLALGVDHSYYVNFLLVLGIVFVPMMLIVLMDYFLFKVRSDQLVVDYLALMSLAAGIITHVVLSAWLQERDISPQLASAFVTVIVHGTMRALRGLAR